MTSPIDVEILIEALRQAPSVIVITDEEMTIIYVNRVQGGFKLEDVIGSRHGYSLPPEQRRKTEAWFERARATGEPQHYETFHDAPDGKRRWYSSQIVAYEVGEGGPYGTISILTDVTREREAEVRVESLRRRLLEATHRAGMAEVAAGVLHNVGSVLTSADESVDALLEQLRSSPLRPLGGIAAMLALDEPRLAALLTHDPDARELPASLGEIHRALEAEQQGLRVELGRLRTQVGLMRSIVAAQQNIAKLGDIIEPVRPQELVHLVLSMFQLDLEARFIDLRLELEDLGSVLLDRQATLQVLTNVIRNAIEALEAVERTHRLVIRLWTEEQTLCFEVEDDGCGIRPEHLDKLFQHGFSTKSEGQGFGLYTAAIAARTMNGTLEAHSDGPDRGARVRLTLPKVLP
jgi:PAS domain S-box-containing protein